MLVNAAIPDENLLVAILVCIGIPKSNIAGIDIKPPPPANVPIHAEMIPINMMAKNKDYTSLM